MSSAQRAKMTRNFILKDQETPTTWRADARDIGSRFQSIRLQTPCDFKWSKKKLKFMSRRDLANHINAKLNGEAPITECIIARIERNQNLYGGYWMRICQIARGLRLTIEVKESK